MALTIAAATIRRGAPVGAGPLRARRPRAGRRAGRLGR